MEKTLEVLALIVVGWVAGAESGSWACVQPLVPRLSYEHQVALEKGLLRTFGRVMPVLMPLGAILLGVLVVASRDAPPIVFWLRVVAVAFVAITIVTTLTINVPINVRTGRWEPSHDEREWTAMRARWRGFQGLRAVLLVVAFGLMVVATVLA